MTPEHENEMSGLPVDREIPDVQENSPSGIEAAVDAMSQEEKAEALSGGMDILQQLAMNPTDGNLIQGDAQPVGGPTFIVETPPEKPPVQIIEAGKPLKAVVPPAATVAENSAPAKHSAMLTVEEAKELGIDTEEGTVITEELIMKEGAQKAEERRRQAEDDDAKMMANEVLAAEYDRLQRLENTIALPDDDPRKIELLGPKKSVVQETTVTAKEREKEDRRLGLAGYDEDDLLPAYATDEPEKPEEPEAEDTPPSPGEAEYADYVKGLEVVDVVHTTKPVLMMLREPQVEDVVEAPKKRNPQNLGDQAFMNAITRFKQERFGKVTVPLVNSGFMADVVGTGVVDLQQLYINVSEDTKVYEYQMEQMRVIIRNVTGTNPKIDPIELRNKIHYTDFKMLAFAHLCATLKTVESVTNCPKCGSAFRITVRPSELLINMDELSERANQIAMAPNVESFSLMSRYKIITTSNGIVITLGHPSYANELTLLNTFLAYYNSMTPADQYRFQTRLDDLYFIRKIQLPTGVVTNNIYQNYIALGLLAQEDMETVSKEILKMRKEILEPKFGIREAVCPHCGEVVKNVAYRNILDLLFLHTQLEQYIRQPATKKEDTPEA